MEEEKVKKKTISLTTRFRKLTKRYKELDESNDYLRMRCREHRDELEIVKKLFPLKYYKIIYKIMNNDKNTSKYEVIKTGFSIEHTICVLKSYKTFPDSFELIDIKELK